MPDIRVTVIVPGVPKVTVNNVGLPGPAGADGAPGPNVTANDVEITDDTKGVIQRVRGEATKVRTFYKRDNDNNIVQDFEIVP